jgi:protease-4
MASKTQSGRFRLLPSSSRNTPQKVNNASLDTRQLLIFGGPVLSLILYLFFVSSTFGFQWGPVGTVVGVVRIDGAISPDGQSSARNVIPQLEKVFTYPNVKAVVLSIDSPGGAAVEAELIYGAMQDLQKKHPKPVVAVISNLGASAAYMIAMHTDKIYAARFSLVGSIGTTIEGWDAHRLLEHFDISQRVYSSGPLKSMLSPFLPMSEEADKKARDLVQQAGKLFVDDLKQARGTRLKSDIDYGTGEVWSWEQARAIGLVDEIGTLDEVVAKNFNAKAYDFSHSRQGFGALMSVFQGFLRAERSPSKLNVMRCALRVPDLGYGANPKSAAGGCIDYRRANDRCAGLPRNASRRPISSS